MSPARSRRTPVPHRRSRAEIVTAVGVGVGIVVVTAVVIWLVRPGPVGTLGTGGLMSRQPRASWLVGAALALSALATWWILRVSRRVRGHEKLVLPIALGVVAVAAVAGAFAWPGGVLRHDVAPPKPVTPVTTSTTVPSSTTRTTGAPSSSSTGPTTTAATSTPTTGTSTTKGP
jgi:hypothetical protein